MKNIAIVALCVTFLSCTKTEPPKMTIQAHSMAREALALMNPDLQLEKPVLLSIIPAVIGTTLVREGLWNTAAVMKDIFNSTPDLVAYVTPSRTTVNHYSYILYNITTGLFVKMYLDGKPVGIGSTRWTMITSAGAMVYTLTITGDVGTGGIIGTAPDLRSLGSFRVLPDPLSSCSRTGGFQACVICSHKDCNDTFSCLIACTVSSITCMAAWIVSCAILNTPGSHIIAPGTLTPGSIPADWRVSAVYLKSTLSDTLIKIH